MDFGTAHERHLAAHRIGTATVWCENLDCSHHWQPSEVGFESEYGQGWHMPEECPECGSGWTEDEPVHKCDSCHFTLAQQDTRIRLGEIWLCEECAPASRRTDNPEGGN